VSCAGRRHLPLQLVDRHLVELEGGDAGRRLAGDCFSRGVGHEPATRSRLAAGERAQSRERATAHESPAIHQSLLEDERQSIAQTGGRLLESDHEPVVVLGNISLLCPAHNRSLAEHDYGGAAFRRHLQKERRLRT
jgi:hypothetical protein